MISNEKVDSYKLVYLVEYYNFNVLTFSPFNNVNHFKFDPKTYIEYLNM